MSPLNDLNAYNVEPSFNYVVSTKPSVKKKKKILVILLLVLLVGTLVSFSYFGLYKPLSNSSVLSPFSLHYINIYGIDGANRDTIKDALSEFLGRNIFAISSENIKEKISKFGFVEGFLFRRNLPNEITLEIKPKENICTIKQRGKNFAIDGEGNFWETSTMRENCFEVTSKVDLNEKDFQTLIKELKNNNLNKECFLIDYLDPNSYIVSFKDGNSLIFFGNEFKKEWAKYNEGKDWINRNIANKGIFDLRWSNRIVFKAIQSESSSMEEKKDG
jgi:cell division septal protein FtsQ